MTVLVGRCGVLLAPLVLAIGVVMAGCSVDRSPDERTAPETEPTGSDTTNDPDTTTGSDTANGPDTATGSRQPTSPAEARRGLPPYGFSPGAELQRVDDSRLAGDMDAMVAAGAAWVRLDVDWSTIEREPGGFDWSAADRLIDAARQRGLKVLALLAYSPSWATGEDRSDKAPPDDDRAFAEFAYQAALRYQDRGVAAWQIWNEPNSALFWETGPDPDRYGALLITATAAVRRADPDAVVISAGLAPAVDRPDDGWLSPETYLARLIDTGALAEVDAVAVHPYSFPALPLDPESAAWNTFLKLPNLHQLLVRSDNTPDEIWITEYGAPTGEHQRSVDEESQAAMVDQALDAAGDRPWLGPVFLFSLRDSAPDPRDLERNYGILNYDGSPKLAWHRLLARADPDR